jgi:hypothetical protein
MQLGVPPEYPIQMAWSNLNHEHGNPLSIAMGVVEPPHVGWVEVWVSPVIVVIVGGGGWGAARSKSRSESRLTDQILLKQKQTRGHLIPRAGGISTP